MSTDIVSGLLRESFRRSVSISGCPHPGYVCHETRRHTDCRDDTRPRSSNAGDSVSSEYFRFRRHDDMRWRPGQNITGRYVWHRRSGLRQGLLVVHVTMVPTGLEDNHDGLQSSVQRDRENVAVRVRFQFYPFDSILCLWRQKSSEEGGYDSWPDLLWTPGWKKGILLTKKFSVKSELYLSENLLDMVERS